MTIPERPSADVIVVAAGTSRRFGRDKLDVPVGGRPLMAWTLERVAAAPEVDRIVLVTSAERVDDLRATTRLPTAVAAGHASLYGRWEVDDAGITFAYARSVATGAGPVETSRLTADPWSTVVPPVGL